MISGMGKTGDDVRLGKRDMKGGRGGIAFTEELEGNVSALSLAVDGETTPQVLLDSLNAATMAQNMRSQENLIRSLRAQLEEAHEGIQYAEAEGVRLKDVDEYEGRNRIEIDTLHRRQELLHSSLEVYMNISLYIYVFLYNIYIYIYKY
jgi:hypothetical protein